MIKALNLLIFSTLFLITASCSDKVKSDTKTSEITLIKEDLKEPSNETPDDLGASFLLAVKNNDRKMIEKFLPSKDDVSEIMQYYVGDEADKKSILDKSEINTDEIRRNATKSITDIIDRGTKNRVKWNESYFSSSELKTKKENNIEFAELTIHFQYHETTYKIKIPECIKSNRGWLIFDKPKWVGK